MIRFLRAFVWLRWRMLINSVRGGRRRDAGDRFSRISAIVVPILVLLVCGGAAVVLGVVALVGGYLMGTGAVRADVGAMVVRGILLLVLGFTLFVPLARSLHGVAASMDRLRLLPIATRTLHGVEVATTVADPWIAFLIPALVLLPVGLAFAGRYLGALMVLVLGACYLGVLAGLGALLSFLLQWLLRDRRRSEVATLVFVLVLSSAGMLPSFFAVARSDDDGPPRRSERRDDDVLPAWTRVIPSELCGRSMKEAIETTGSAGLLGALGLMLQATVLVFLSSRVYDKVLASPARTRSRRQVSLEEREGARIPGLSAAAVAVARIQFRTAMRTVRGKLSVYSGGPVLLLLGLMFSRVARHPELQGLIHGHGHLFFSLGFLFNLVSLQPILVNQFATDQAGLTLEFLAPVSDWDIVRGKTAGCAVMAGWAALLCLVAALIVAPGGSPLSWVAAFLGSVSVFLLLAPAAALLSVVFPKVADLGRIGTPGNPHAAAALIGGFLTMVLAGPPASIMAISSLLQGSPIVVLGLMAAWTAVAAGLSLPLLKAVSRALNKRRENLLLVAAGG